MGRNNTLVPRVCMSTPRDPLCCVEKRRLASPSRSVQFWSARAIYVRRLQAVGILLRLKPLFKGTCLKVSGVELIDAKHEVGNGAWICAQPQHEHAFPKTEQHALVGLLNHPEPKRLLHDAQV
jgi:hypothetical protein